MIIFCPHCDQPSRLATSTGTDPCCCAHCAAVLYTDRYVLASVGTLGLTQTTDANLLPIQTSDVVSDLALSDLPIDSTADETLLGLAGDSEDDLEVLELDEADLEDDDASYELQDLSSEFASAGKLDLSNSPNRKSFNIGDSSANEPPNNRKKSSGSLIPIVLGGFASLPIAVAIMWYGMGVDPLHWAPVVSKYAPWAVPAALQGRSGGFKSASGTSVDVSSFSQPPDVELTLPKPGQNKSQAIKNDPDVSDWSQTSDPPSLDVSSTVAKSSPTFPKDTDPQPTLYSAPKDELGEPISLPPLDVELPEKSNTANLEKLAIDWHDSTESRINEKKLTSELFFGGLQDILDQASSGANNLPTNEVGESVRQELSKTLKLVAKSSSLRDLLASAGQRMQREIPSAGLAAMDILELQITRPVPTIDAAMATEEGLIELVPTAATPQRVRKLMIVAKAGVWSESLTDSPTRFVMLGRITSSEKQPQKIFEVFAIEPL